MDRSAAQTNSSYANYMYMQSAVETAMYYISWMCVTVTQQLLKARNMV